MGVPNAYSVAMDATASHSTLTPRRSATPPLSAAEPSTRARPANVAFNERSLRVPHPLLLGTVQHLAHACARTR
jgi:hypothetical protein